MRKSNINVIKNFLNTNCDLHIKNFDSLSAIDYCINLNETTIYELLVAENNRRNEEAKKQIVREKAPIQTVPLQTVQTIIQTQTADDIFETYDNSLITSNSTNQSKKNISPTSRDSRNKALKTTLNNSTYQEQYKRYALNLSSSENTDVQISIDIPCSFESDEKSKDTEKTQSLNNYISKYGYIFLLF